MKPSLIAGNKSGTDISLGERLNPVYIGVLANDAGARAPADLRAGKELTASVGGRGVLDGAFSLLDILSELEEAGLTRLSAVSGLPKATAYRLLQQMTEVGAVEKTGDRYRLGPRFFALAQAWRPDPALSRAARLPIRNLARTTGASIGMCVLVNKQVTLVGGIPGTSGWLVPMERGMIWPRSATAAGKILSAWVDPGPTRASGPAVSSSQLEEIQQSGIVLDRQETMSGVCCAAVPLFGADLNAPVAALWAMVNPRYPLPQLASMLSRTSSLIGAAMR